MNTSSYRWSSVLGQGEHKMCRKAKAPSTLIRFQTKPELFCSVFKKICVHTYRFRIVFAQ